MDAQGRKTGGRAKGTQNKSTIAKHQIIENAARRAAEGMTPEEAAAMLPLDVMLHVMKVAVMAGQWSVAAAHAQAAAPYVHARLNSNKNENVTRDPNLLTDAELAAAVLAERDRKRKEALAPEKPVVTEPQFRLAA